MNRLLQINICANWGSTGRIVEHIGNAAINNGWESVVYYGDFHNISTSRLIKAPCRFPFMYEHYFECYYMDREGLASRIPTLHLIRQIKKMKPDIIHLHIIHDHWLNYPMLFRFLSKSNIPVVWTFHDIWAITGHCYTYTLDCDKWKAGCDYCPLRNKFGPDRSKRNYELKKHFFSSINNITIVTVSEWLGCLVQQSFLGNRKIYVIPNGIDTDVFRPSPDCFNSDLFKDKTLILAVAQVWDKGKNLQDYYLLRELLGSKYVILLVGLTKTQINSLPAGIVGMERTHSQKELAGIYSRADVTLSLSASETFGMTIIESMSCGTPVVVYDNTGQRSLVTEDTGMLVPSGDVKAVKDAILTITSYPKDHYSQSCRSRVEENYNLNKQYSKYIDLYNNILEA